MSEETIAKRIYQVRSTALSGMVRYVRGLNDYLADKESEFDAFLAERHEEGGYGALSKIHTGFVRDRVTCAIADNLSAYFANLLRIVFRSYPKQMLSRLERGAEEGDGYDPSDLRIPLRSILEYEDLGHLLTGIAEERVYRLTYRSLNELDSYFRKNFSLALSTDEVDLAVAKRLISTRNALVHNPGFEPERLRKPRQKKAWFLEDEVLSLDQSYPCFPGAGGWDQDIWDYVDSCDRIVEDLDGRAVEKFGIATTG